MTWSGSLSAWSRRISVAVGVAALACASSSVKAQDPAPQAPAQAQQDGLKFNHDGEMLIVWQIKPERAADFQSGWTTIKTLLAASQKPDVKAFGDALHISRVVTGTGGPAIFVFQLSPASKTFSYNPVPILFEMLKPPPPDPAAAPDAPNPPGTVSDTEAREIFDKINDSWVENGIVPWPLQKIAG
jgi:hypothetical protein